MPSTPPREAPRQPENPVARNVAVIAEIEQAARRQQSASDRVSDAIAQFSGSMLFVVIHAAWFVIWILLNSGGFGRPFDPFPYSLLTLLVSLEAIFLSTFVLISQNQMAKLSDRRAHLDLQVNLLAESEMTKVLEMLQAIAEKLGIDKSEDNEMREMAKPTDLQDVARKIDATEK